MIGGTNRIDIHPCLMLINNVKSDDNDSNGTANIDNNNDNRDKGLHWCKEVSTSSYDKLLWM